MTRIIPTNVVNERSSCGSEIISPQMSVERPIVMGSSIPSTGSTIASFPRRSDSNSKRAVKRTMSPARKRTARCFGSRKSPPSSLTINGKITIIPDIPIKKRDFQIPTMRLDFCIKKSPNPQHNNAPNANKIPSIFMVRPEGFEPPTTASKAVMISVSLRAQHYHSNVICIKLSNLLIS